MARILIVEDNDMLNTAYTFMLKAKGHEVVSAFDGLQGLDQAAAFKPEIILLDYLMPNLDGLGFLQRYDVAGKHPDVKVVLLTNLSEEDKVNEAMDLGVTRYLQKAQVEPFQLVDAVDSVLKA